MINQDNIKEAITTHIEFVNYVEKVIKTMRETYPGKYHQYRPIKDLKVTNTEITYLEEDYNGDETDVTFPISHLYLSEKELINVVQQEKEADRLAAEKRVKEREEADIAYKLSMLNKLALEIGKTVQ